MPYRFFVPGPLPAQNEMIASAKGYGGRGFGYSKVKAEWTSTIAWIVKAAHIPKMSRVRCRFEWVSANKRHDPDNIEAGQKFVWDALKVAGVIPNDGWDQNAGSEHLHAIGPKPGVWVTVEDATDFSRALTPVVVDVVTGAAEVFDGRHTGVTPKGG
jgi:Holliday junction resolvase RusA-like endonuclease